MKTHVQLPKRYANTQESIVWLLENLKDTLEKHDCKLTKAEVRSLVEDVLNVAVSYTDDAAAAFPTFKY